MNVRPFDAEGDLQVIVETPRGSGNKYAWDPDRGAFAMKSVLPAGAVFPWDFGYIPETRGEDGDPLDVLLLMEHPTFPGCLVRARLIGVIEAEQGEGGEKKERNDRLIAVAAKSRVWGDVEKLGDLDDSLVAEIEHFFVSYNEWKDKTFEPIGRHGPDRAKKLVERGAGKRAEKKEKKKK